MERPTMYEMHVDFSDGSRASYDYMSLGDVLTIVSTFDNLSITECSISPVDD